MGCWVGPQGLVGLSYWKALSQGSEHDWAEIQGHTRRLSHSENTEVQLGGEESNAS